MVPQSNFPIRNFLPATRYSLLVCLSVALLGPAAIAKDELSVSFNLGWENHCRPTFWTPANVVINSASSKTIVGTIELTSIQDALHRLSLVQPVALLPGQALTIPFYTKTSWNELTFDLRLRNQSGRVVWSKSFDLNDYSQAASGMTTVMPGQIFTAFSGRGYLRFVVPNKLNEAIEQLFRVSVYPSDLPTAWPGYAALDLLVLHNLDWSLLSRAQLQALADWISNGGKAIVYLGGSAIPTDSAMGRAVPFKLTPPLPKTLPQEMLGAWKMGQTPVELPVWQIKADELPPAWKVLEVADDGTPLRVIGNVGFGRLAICGYDPSQLPTFTNQQADPFWFSQFEPLLGSERLTPSEVKQNYAYGPYGYYNYASTLSGSGTNNILAYLQDIPQLGSFNIWWIALVLGLMALILGPVDYLILKRLNRLPYTWLTFAAVIALTTSGAYYGVQYIRAGDTELRRVSIIDHIDNTDETWMTAFTGIYASRNGNYPLEGIEAGGWWSGAAPATGYYSGGGVRFAIHCAQQGGNLPVKLPINIWQMRMLLEEGRCKQFPISSDIRAEGKHVSGKIINQGVAAIAEGIVQLGGQSLPFGRIESGASVELDGLVKSSAKQWKIPKIDFSRNEHGYFNQQVHQTNESLLPARALWSSPSAARTEGVQSWLDDGEVVIYAKIEDNAPTAVGIKDRNFPVTHTAFYRLVVPQGEGQ